MIFYCSQALAVPQDFSKDIDWAVGARPLVSAYRGGSKENAKCFTNGPIPQLANFNDFTCIGFLGHVHRYLEIDFIAPGIYLALDGQLLQHLLCSGSVIQPRRQGKIFELDMDLIQVRTSLQTGIMASHQP